MPAINEEIMKVIRETLREKFGHATQSQLDLMAADILKRTGERTSRGRMQISMSKLIRGNVCRRAPGAQQGDDGRRHRLRRALSTTGAPGSYLVPTLQANEISPDARDGRDSPFLRLPHLADEGVQKLNVPTAFTAPQWVWMAQNSVQRTIRSEPGPGGVRFERKTLPDRRTEPAARDQRSRIRHAHQSVIGLAAGEHEDTAFFASAHVSGGPAASPGAEHLHAQLGGSANGGNLAYSDIFAILAKAAAAKAKPPFAWYMSPRTFYQRVLGMIDLSSRPIVIPTQTTGLYPQVQFSLMGWPVYISPFILENEALGSGTNRVT